LPIVRFEPDTGERSLDLARWSLVPFWAKDIKVGCANINAKAEGVDTHRPSVRHSSGGGAWRRSIAFMNGRRLRPANVLRRGLRHHGAGRDWENWRSPAEEWVRSFTIVQVEQLRSFGDFALGMGLGALQAG
jgi:hypothetical protein